MSKIGKHTIRSRLNEINKRNGDCFCAVVADGFALLPADFSVAGSRERLLTIFQKHSVNIATLYRNCT